MEESNTVASARPLSGQHRWNRPNQNSEVNPKIPTFDVINVELDLAGKVDLAPAADLPQAGDPWFYGQAPAVCRRIH
jgi:hypothetical protein